MENLIYQYLTQNKYTQTYFQEFKENYQSHPNYPSLYAITDSLELMGIETITATVPKEQLKNLPDVFITSLYIGEKAEFVLVNKTQTGITYTNQKEKTKSLSFDEFSAIWDGLILAIGENEKLEVRSQKMEVKSTINNFLLLTSVIIAVYFLNGTFSWFSGISLLLSVFGLLIGIFIIQESLGEANPVVSKVCNGTNNTVSCDSVVKSNEGKLFFGISFSDLPIVFFFTNLDRKSNHKCRR